MNILNTFREGNQACNHMVLKSPREGLDTSKWDPSLYFYTDKDDIPKQIAHVLKGCVLTSPGIVLVDPNDVPADLE